MIYGCLNDYCYANVCSYYKKVILKFTVLIEIELHTRVFRLAVFGAFVNYDKTASKLEIKNGELVVQLKNQLVLGFFIE